MKKIILNFIPVALIALAFSSCGPATNTNSTTTGDSVKVNTSTTTTVVKKDSTKKLDPLNDHPVTVPHSTTPQ